MYSFRNIFRDVEDAVPYAGEAEWRGCKTITLAGRARVFACGKTIRAATPPLLIVHMYTPLLSKTGVRCVRVISAGICTKSAIETIASKGIPQRDVEDAVPYGIYIFINDLNCVKTYTFSPVRQKIL